MGSFKRFQYILITLKGFAVDMSKWNTCQEKLNAVSSEEQGKAQLAGVVPLSGLQENRAVTGVELQGEECAQCWDLKAGSQKGEEQNGGGGAECACGKQG